MWVFDNIGVSQAGHKCHVLRNAHSRHETHHENKPQLVDGLWVMNQCLSTQSRNDHAQMFTAQSVSLQELS